MLPDYAIAGFVDTHARPRDAVPVHFLVRAHRAPAAAQTLLVLLEPPAGERLVADAEPGGLLPAVLGLGQELVEGPVVRGLQIGPVPLGRQPGVAVGRDDQVGMVPVLRSGAQVSSSRMKRSR